MDKVDIEICEKMLTLFNEMYFKELHGKDLIEKFVVFQNFAKVVSKYKNPPKLAPVKNKPVKKVKNAGK